MGFLGEEDTPSELSVFHLPSCTLRDMGTCSLPARSFQLKALGSSWGWSFLIFGGMLGMVLLIAEDSIPPPL